MSRSTSGVTHGSTFESGCASVYGVPSKSLQSSTAPMAVAPRSPRRQPCGPRWAAGGRAPGCSPSGPRRNRWRCGGCCCFRRCSRLRCVLLSWCFSGCCSRFGLRARLHCVVVMCAGNWYFPCAHRPFIRGIRGIGPRDHRAEQKSPIWLKTRGGRTEPAVAPLFPRRKGPLRL